MIQANPRGYASTLPIADALDSAWLIQNVKTFRRGGGAAQAVDKGGIRVLIVIHGFSCFARLNTMFNDWVNTTCINGPFSGTTISP
ncbi:hypothetical protein HLB01_05610 [Bordetella trematum]|uniref:hypothetical protein n=1 Tax=Bordetella trematum TaxID=123899 RepID=UPI000ACE334C|nr:hypothetical protein [Bordetella trematum]NNH18515.1 hypothetical protein [Bordetella trematum]